MDAPPTALDAARSRVAELEDRWSRFRPWSELSRLNAGGGERVEVSRDTFELVERSVSAWSLTGGLFDPSVHDAVIAAGYRRDFASWARGSQPRWAESQRRPASGMGAVKLDAAASAVTLPRGLRIDPGGIGKGLAADIVSRELVAAGAEGALVNVGGDLRARGRPDSPYGWVVSIEDPFDRSREIARLALGEGSIATSTRVRRSWNTSVGRQHHLIDPRSGWPAWPGSAQSTAVAGDGWWAEALAKAAFLLGARRGPLMLADVGAVGFIVDDGGGLHDSPGLEEVIA